MKGNSKHHSHWFSKVAHRSPNTLVLFSLAYCKAAGGAEFDPVVPPRYRVSCLLFVWQAFTD